LSNLYDPNQKNRWLFGYFGLSNQVYNYIMPRDHFAQLNRQTSHRHDSLHDAEQFNNVMQAITGMLYSIVTLRAFFPFFKSPAEIVDNTIIDAPYPMPSQNAGDQEEQNYPL
jgi:hypothetical protein